LLNFSSDIHVLLFERSCVLPLETAPVVWPLFELTCLREEDGYCFFASSRQGSCRQDQVLRPLIATILETDFERVDDLGKGTLLGVDDNQFCKLPVPGDNLGIRRCSRLVEQQDHPLTCHEEHLT
jgi:hypothetical protein